MPFNVLVKPSEELDRRMYDLDDQGNLIVSFDSIKLVDADLIVGE